MSNALITVYDRITDPASFVKSMGREIAASKMFGELTVAQGEVFALECAARRMPPLMLAEKYHVIFGKLSMKAEAMLGEFHARGGKSKILSRTPELVAVELEFNGDKQKFELSWEDAQQESFCYEIKSPMTEDKVIEAILAWKAGQRGAKQPNLKTKYKTPRSRTQMLWARLVSDAVRAMMPEVNSGRYTPEEFDAGGDGEALDVEYEVVPEPELAAEAKTEKASSKPSNGTNGTNGNGQHAEKPAAAPAPQAATTQPTSTLASTEQVERMILLAKQLGMNQQQIGGAIAARGVATWSAFSQQQAVEFIAKVEGILEKQRAAREAAEAAEQAKASQQQVATPATPSVDPDEPCTETQVQQVKQLLGEINQTDPGFAKGFQERYWATGREKVAELHYGEAVALIEALKGKNLESFFENSLQPHPKTKEEVPFSVE